MNILALKDTGSIHHHGNHHRKSNAYKFPYDSEKDTEHTFTLCLTATVIRRMKTKILSLILVPGSMEKATPIVK